MQKRCKNQCSEHVKKNAVCQKKRNDYGFRKTLEIIGKTTFPAIRRLPLACQENTGPHTLPPETNGNQWKTLVFAGSTLPERRTVQGAVGATIVAIAKNYGFPKTVENHWKINDFRSIRLSVNAFRPVPLGCQENNKTSPC